MYPLDHIAFHGPSLDRLHKAFEDLGFAVSAKGAYRNTQTPPVYYRNRSVFLQNAWLDLLEAEAEAGAPDALVTPGAFLFRTADLEEAVGVLEREEIPCGQSYRLLRHWDQYLDEPEVPFDLCPIRPVLYPLPSLLVENIYPTDDIRSEWFDHPNTVSDIAELSFLETDGEAGQSDLLDLKGAVYRSADEFLDVFGVDPPERDRSGLAALTFRVHAPDAAREALERSGAPFLFRGETLVVPAGRVLACAVAFSPA